MASVYGLGLVAVFDYHRKMDYADLYSLHSWCGILVFVLYFIQVSLSSTPGPGHCIGERRKRLKCLQQRGSFSKVAQNVRIGWFGWNVTSRYCDGNEARILGVPSPGAFPEDLTHGHMPKLLSAKYDGLCCGSKASRKIALSTEDQDPFSVSTLSTLFLGAR